MNKELVDNNVTQPSRLLVMINNIILVAGLLIFMLGLPIAEGARKELLFAAGSFLLAIGSYFEKEYFFACLEGVLIVSAFLTLFHVPLLGSIIILVALNIVVLFVLLRTRSINFHLLSGIIGLLLLTGGIVFNTNTLMVIAGIVLAVYSYFSAKAGYKVGWIFLFLNILFTIIAIMNLHATG